MVALTPQEKEALVTLAKIARLTKEKLSEIKEIINSDYELKTVLEVEDSYTTAIKRVILESGLTPTLLNELALDLYDRYILNEVYNLPEEIYNVAEN